MMILFAALLFPILCIVRGGSIHPSTDDCDTGIIQRCPTSWLVAYFEANIVLVPGSFLDTHCDSILEFVECVHDFQISCYKNEHSALTFSSYDGMVGTLLKLCDKSSQLRAEYETFVPCVDNTENGFRYIISKSVMDISDLVFAHTNFFRNDLTKEQSKEIACIFLTTHVPKFMEAFFEKCGMLMNVTFNETASRYFSAIESECPSAATVSDVNVTDTASTEEAYLTVATQEYSGMGTTAVTNAYNVSMDIRSPLKTPCSTDWLQNLLNSSNILSDFLNKHCRDIQSFADCIESKSDTELDKIVIQSGVPSVNFTSSYIELVRLCENRRHAPEYLTTDDVQYNDADWNTYNCSDDPVLPHHIQWITGKLSGSLIPYPKVLQDNCPKLLTEMQRLLHYKAKCGARYSNVDGNAPNPYRSYTDLLPVFEQLCNNETTLWKDYEKYSPCIKRQEGFFTSIIDIAKADLKFFTAYVSKQSLSYARFRAARARIYIMRAVYIPLVLDAVQNQCGTDSAVFLEDLLDNFLHPVETYCPNEITFLHKMWHIYVTYRLQIVEHVPPTIPPWKTLVMDVAQLKWSLPFNVKPRN